MMMRSGWMKRRRHGGTAKEREGGRGDCAAVFFWLLSKGSVASSEQTKYRPQLKRTFPLQSERAFREAMGEKENEKKKSTCLGSVLSLCNDPRPARIHQKPSVALITRRSGSALLFLSSSWVSIHRTFAPFILALSHRPPSCLHPCIRPR